MNTMGAKVLFAFLLTVISVSAFPKGCITPTGLTGTCKAMHLCPPYGEAESKSNFSSNKEKRDFLLTWRCRRYGNEVCCPSDTVYTEPPPSVSGHKNLRLLPALQDCGEKSEDRLSGGNHTNPMDYPWMALISAETDGELDFICGGAIINNRYILTAAHCVTQLGRSRLAGVRLGEHDITTVEDCKFEDECADPVKDVGIENIILHPDYIGMQPGRPHDLTNDIALIRLDEPINIKDLNNILPICLPVTEELQNFNLEKAHLLLTGWGRTNVARDGEIVENRDEPSSVLLEAKLPFVTNRICAESFNGSGIGGIGFRQLCAGGDNGVNTCGGDSGGPLIAPVVLRRDVRMVQYGIVSAGVQTCGKERLPSIFTSVVQYMDWILDQLKP